MSFRRTPFFPNVKSNLMCFIIGSSYIVIDITPLLFVYYFVFLFIFS